jgi:hypothetical protein
MFMHLRCCFPWLMVLMLGGCREAPPTLTTATAQSEDALLISGTTPSQRMIQGGERRCGESIQHEFVITAWQHAPVQIKSVRLGCGCGKLTPDLAGVTLEPGQTVRLILDLMRPQRAGELVAALTVDAVTMNQPCTYHFGVTYQLFGAPPQGPDLVCMTVPLAERPRTTFRITRWRLPTEPPLVWNASASSFGPFQGKLVLSESAPKKQYEGQVRPLNLDQFDFEIIANEEMKVGEHLYTLNVAFQGHEPVKVPVKVAVLHPLRPSLSALFAGRLEPGQKWSYSARWLRTGKQEVRVANVTSSDEAIKASATLDFLFVTVTAPQEPGRFAGHVELQFDSPSAPPLRLPVSALVVPPKSRP